MDTMKIVEPWLQLTTVNVVTWLSGVVLAYLVWTYKIQLQIIPQLILVGLQLKRHSFLHTRGPFSVLDEIEANVDKYPDVVQFIMAETGRSRSKRHMDELANQVGHWALSQGCKPFDTMALMMLNNEDYVSIWMGFAKIGAATALINTNITGKPLSHSVNTALQSSETKILIVDSELEGSLKEELVELASSGVKIFYWSADKTARYSTSNLKLIIERQPVTRIDRSHRETVTEKDPLIFVFTSGTTGLPKACKISQTRFQAASFFFPHFCLQRRQRDVMYTPLPLYHSAAGMIAVGGALRANVTLVLRKKFSVSSFSSDLVKYKVTTVQYIGELCRYLANAPPNPLDKQVKLLFAMGNGMRPEYWHEFQTRYSVAFIAEFYAATEGNIGLFNILSMPGAIGFIPSVGDFLSPFRLLRVDPADPSMPLRNSQGRCTLAAFYEPGLLVGSISSKDVTRRFDGYSDAQATAQKVLKGVFRDGDAYFNTGDLLYRDIWGFYFWSDRVGDTFRWKGENVSTTEVGQVLSHCTEVLTDNTVYGVSVPKSDGRAGMAAVVLQEGMTIAHDTDRTLRAIVQTSMKHLPSYARPLFVRMRPHSRPLPVTSTHKYVKSDLVKEGFDPRKQTQQETDPIYIIFYPPKVSGEELDSQKMYWQEVTPELIDQLERGEEKGLRI